MCIRDRCKEIERYGGSCSSYYYCGVLPKSFARIHVANLINAGILPLTFADPADYDRIGQDDVLTLSDLSVGMDRGSITVTDETKHIAFSACCTLTERQRAILKAGGLLNYTKENGK